MQVTNFLGEACQANWKGRGGFSLYAFSLYAQLRPTYTIVSMLGWVKKKNDGRWSWWICREKTFFTPVVADGPVEGVVATEEEAKRHLERVWGATRGE